MGMKSRSYHMANNKSGGESIRLGKSPNMAYNPWRDDDLYKELMNSGIKFTKEKVVFVVKDKTGQLMWLEKGNYSTGLDHIIERHENDFKKLHNIPKSQIASHIKEIIVNGIIEYTKATNRNGQNCLEKLCSYEEKYYLLLAVGTNGYIVSSYPLDERTARIYIRRNSKWKNK